MVVPTRTAWDRLATDRARGLAAPRTSLREHHFACPASRNPNRYVGDRTYEAIIVRVHFALSGQHQAQEPGDQVPAEPACHQCAEQHGRQRPVAEPDHEVACGAEPRQAADERRRVQQWQPGKSSLGGFPMRRTKSSLGGVHMWRRDMTAGRMGNVAMAQVRLNVGAGVNNAPNAKQARKTVSIWTCSVWWCTPRTSGCQSKGRIPSLFCCGLTSTRRCVILC
jgi:hypothetical protein